MSSFLYEYKNNLYNLREDENAEMKTKDGWVPAVLYSPYYGNPFTIYIRDKKDFFKKFKEMSEDEYIKIQEQIQEKTK